MNFRTAFKSIPLVSESMGWLRVNGTLALSDPTSEFQDSPDVELPVVAGNYEGRVWQSYDGTAYVVGMYLDGYAPRQNAMCYEDTMPNESGEVAFYTNWQASRTPVPMPENGDGELGLLRFAARMCADRLLCHSGRTGGQFRVFTAKNRNGAITAVEVWFAGSIL